MQQRSLQARGGGHTSVLVCGGGPAGLAIAIELGIRGVDCVVVEPRTRPTRLRPRAKTLNTRTLEHFRRWGIADRVRAAALLPTQWSQDVAFRTRFLGPEITRIRGVLGLGNDDVSPERGQQMPQYLLEEVLREVVSELPSVALRLGSRVTSLRACGDDIEVRICDPVGETSPVDAAYVVGADGARSVVRDQIGARYEGSHALRPNTGIVFRSEQLAALSNHAPAVQTWLLNDTTPGMMGPVDLHGLWWLIAFGVDGTSPDLDPRRLIDGAVGKHLPIEVISTDPWTARMELADHCRHGRVFLIGDAAHLNPPFGGHGLNTGIGDAVDLGWKLAAALEGWGGPGLLDSYEAERRPLHRRVIDEAVANMATLAPELLSDDLDRPGPTGEQARARLAERIHATKTREFHSLDLVLGHRYESSPVVGLDPRDGSWRATALPGARLPHRWVCPGTSTLDLVGGDHVLLTGPGVAVGPVSARAATISLTLRIVRTEADVVHGLGADWVLVRPDQIVAARGDGAPDPSYIDILTGHQQREVHP
jgi:2-polyprenyl-6-methoxyphenol hydroxylase-like FAD-dependent oxidoreductase